MSIAEFFSGASGGGERGPEGPAGPKGEFNFRGAWLAATAYAKGDAVTVGGVTYACIKAMTAGEDVSPPNATFWSVIAEKGAAGAEGPKGTTGNTGPEGPKGEFLWRGAWLVGTTYAKGDVVREAGTSYVSIKTANTGHEPKLLGEWWEVLAEKGAEGAAGAGAKMSGPEAKAEKTVNKEEEPSATKDCIVLLTMEASSATKFLAKIEVGGVVVAEVTYKAVALGDFTTVTFPCPRGKKWKVPTATNLGKIFASYTFFE